MGDETSGGGFPCECIWNHEMAMRRLLNVLRNSQALCTDTECFEPDVTPSARATQPENLYFLTFVIGIALLLYFIRLRPQRTEPSYEKPFNGNNSNNPPPAPPLN